MTKESKIVRNGLLVTASAADHQVNLGIRPENEDERFSGEYRRASTLVSDAFTKVPLSRYERGSLIAIYETIKATSDELLLAGEVLQTIQDQDISGVQQQLSSLFLLTTGVHFVQAEAVTRLRQIARRMDIEELYPREFEMYAAGTVSSMFAPIEGVLPTDILSGEAQKKYSTAQLIRYCTALCKDDLTEHASQLAVAHPLFGRFPIHAINAVETGLLDAQRAAIVPDLFINRLRTIGQNRALEQAVREQLFKYKKNFERIFGNLFEVFTTPVIQESDVQTAILDSLSDNHIANAKLFIMMGINSQQRLTQVYRALQQTADQSGSTLGIKRFLHSLEELTELEKPFLLTSPDDAKLVIPSQNTPVSIPSYDELYGQIKQILRMRSNPIIGIHPNVVDWQDIIPPDNVTIAIDPKNPKIFSVQLTYETSDGEKQVLVAWFGSKYKSRSNFDWSVLSSPTRPEHDAQSKQLIVVSRDILSKALHFIGIDYERKQGKRPTTQIQPIRKLSWELPIVTETYTSDHVKRKPDINESQPDSAVVTSVVKNNGVTYHIVLPSNVNGSSEQAEDYEKFEKLLEDLQPDDRSAVKTALEKYNELGNKGINKAKRLVTTGIKPRYALRIAGSDSIRVLLQDADSEKGKHRLEIIAIGYRKNIYKKQRDQLY